MQARVVLLRLSKEAAWMKGGGCREQERAPVSPG